MVANIRYPHMINKYLRGKKSIARLIGVVALLLIMVADLHHAHRYVFGIGAIMFAIGGPMSWLMARWRHPHSAGPMSTHNEAGVAGSPGAVE
jgi:hypothetical protein